MVDVAGGVGGPIQGYIAGGRSFEAFCRARPAVPQNAVLLRVMRHPGNAGKFAFYWTDDRHGRLYKDSCESSPDGELRINDAISGRDHAVPFAKLSDAVFAMFRVAEFQK